MNIVKTFPHYEINVRATDNYVPYEEEFFPLHVPIFWMRAAKGKINEPVWCPNFNYATYMFGDETFEITSKYFSREAIFAMKTFERQGCFIVRLADDSAKVANIIIEAYVKKDVLITQYETDSFGYPMLDENGDRIPLIDPVTNYIIKEPGISVKFVARTLKENEKFNELHIRTIKENNVTIEVIPYLAVRATSPGAVLNNLAWKLFYNPNVNSVDANTTASANYYTFKPLQKPYKSDTVQPLYTKYNEAEVNFTIKPNVVLPEYGDMLVSSKEVIESSYSSIDGEALLPFEVHFYNEYLEYVSKLVQGYEISNAEIQSNHWMVNVLSFKTRDNIQYAHVELNTNDSDSILFNDDYNIYIKDGADGNIDDATIEDLTRQYLNMTIFPEFNERAKYPITHIYDTGVSLNTKYALIKFLTTRDDIKISLSTQDANKRKNTKAEDQSIGSALRARCLLQPESVIFGTGCCRAEIMQQAGTLIESNYRGIMPMTYEILDKRSSFQSTNNISGKFKGLPNSNINLIKDFWSPCDDDHKQQSWDSGLNWAQHYDRKRQHFPDIRTVYRFETSVLSDTTFTDALVYSKHVIRRSWAKFVGLDIPSADLHSRIKKDIDYQMNEMCGNMYPSSSTAYQTAEDMRKGYITRVRLEIGGYGISRVWKVEIVCNRENYNNNAA